MPYPDTQLTSEQTDIGSRILETTVRLIYKATISDPAVQPKNSDRCLSETGFNALEQLEQNVWGCFVTVKRNHQLRSCCGTFGREMPLHAALQNAAIRTATNDPRFPRLSPGELPYLHLDVWLLSEPEIVIVKGADRISAVQVGLHGLQIIKDEQRGLLLPSVPVEQGWSAEEYLNRVSLKAGLPPTAWRDPASKLIRFCGEEYQCELADFRDQNWQNDLTTNSITHLPQFHASPYVEVVQQNLQSLLQGGNLQVWNEKHRDERVHGVALKLTHRTMQKPMTLWRFAIRSSFSLRAALDEFSKDAAHSMKQFGLSQIDRHDMEVQLAVFDDPAMHGTLAKPDLRGLEPQKRCLLAQQLRKTAWIYDPSAIPEGLIDHINQMSAFQDRNVTPLYSFRTRSNTTGMSGYAAPKPQINQTARAPAVAGKFYPRSPSALNADLARMFAMPAARQPATAALIPHAGWKFSGQIAADVLKQIEIPQNIIIIGPKHTREGVDWAIAPHQSWMLPNGNMQTNTTLAKQLQSAISGLEYDAAAHKSDHAIEVALPLILHQSPQSQIVGILIGACDYNGCESLARGLASIVGVQPEPPLLLISSDMNHFANDVENRRLDELALQQLRQLNPAGLYETCQQHHISMCGLHPAVITMLALQQLNRLNKCEQVSYATSADVTGDPSRVVGYAGLIFN